jgi:hypothetical protein
MNWKVPGGGEVLAIATASKTSSCLRIAASTRNHVVQVFDAMVKGEPILVWSRGLPKTVPRALQIDEQDISKIHVYSMYDGIR